MFIPLTRKKKVPSHASTALKRVYARPQTDICQLQILADSFEPKFEPFTLEKPRCLLPLANTPLIEYTLEFLANAGVEEVFISCGNHTEQVEAYVAASKWTRPTSPFSVEIVRSSAAHSIGDAMRDMDQKGLLTGDFVCVYGDVVASVGIESAIRAHKQRREKSKNAVMTMVLREAGDQHRTKAHGTRPVFVMDPTKDRCLHYEQMRPGQTHPRLNIDGEILTDCPELEVRADLIDCGIDICSPEVLAQWSDNFDWQQPRRGFLYGTLKDHELNGMTIHTHVATEGYAARVKSLQMYDAVSKDIVGRYSYPLCPDANLLRQQSYAVGKSGVYREEGVVLARSAVVKKKTVLGKATSIGEGSVVTNSVIGRRCVIGRRVKIDGAYIWDDAKIGDDTVIERAVVANEATVGKNCKISPGALVSFSTVVADGTTVQSSGRITRFKRKRGYEVDELVEGTTDPKIVGEGGEGFNQEPDSDDEEDFESLIPQLKLNDDDDAASISTLNSDDEDDSDFETDSQPRSHRAESFGSVLSDESAGEAEARRSAADFHHEAAGSIFDSLQRGDSPDSIQLELKALTLSSNADGNQVRRAVAVAMMKRIASLLDSGLPPQKAVTQTISPNRLLIERAVLDRDEEDNPESVEFLLFVQTDLTHRPQGGKVLLYVCNALVSLEIFESEALHQWLEDERSGATAEMIEVKRETEEIMGDDSEEESSEEEEESDDDDDDE
jgi:translation initiation factor eIF-2B subunit epsilon